MSSGEWRGGWQILSAATLAMATGVGVFVASTGLFVKPIQETQGWTRGEIAGAMSLTILLVGLFMPITGILVDRYGSRRVGIIGMAAYGTFCLTLGIAPPSLTSFYILCIGLSIFGPATGSIAFLPYVGAYFQRWRGLAFGITMAGSSIMLMPLSPILARIIEHSGWRSGYICIGAIALLVGIPAVFWLTRNGAVAGRSGTQTGPSPLPVRSGCSFGEAVRSPAYWALLVASVSCVMPIGGFMNQLFALFSDKGITVGQIGLLSSTFAGAIILGRFAMGTLLDTVPPSAAAFMTMLLPLLAIFILLSDHPSFAACLLSTVLLGYTQGAVGDIEAFFTAHFFGLRSFGRIFSTFGMSNMAALSIGTALFGKIFDAYGSYDPALMASGCSALISALAFFYLGRIRVFKAVAP